MEGASNSDSNAQIFFLLIDVESYYQNQNNTPASGLKLEV